MTAVDSRPAEAEKFFTALQDQPPSALTTCNGWIVHHLGAHIAGAYEEVIRHVDAFDAGRPLTVTRTFEEREPPFHRLSPARLLRALDEREHRMRSVVSAVVADEPDATLA